jgi:hypothetical protein
VAFTFCAQAKEWRGIVPLHSTRSDVEKLLGTPAIARDNFATYVLDHEKVTFDYAVGRCNERTAKWNVPSGTVVSIVVMPKLQGVKFRELTSDFTKFKKVQDEHVLNIFHYTDQQDGVRYEVDESDGTVSLIHYFPASKDEYLRCPPLKSKGSCLPRHQFRRTLPYAASPMMNWLFSGQKARRLFSRRSVEHSLTI